jgi:ribosomal protein L3 glutamine methyltransferase
MFDEAVFLVLRSLHLPLDRLDVVLDARLAPDEIDLLLQRIAARVERRIPAAYLLREAWLQGYRFYVDERTIIPRSFIGELLHDRLAPWVPDPESVADVLDLCTGSGCLAVLAAGAFPHAAIDAADVSPDALEVARRNVADHGLSDRVRLIESDLFAALGERLYDLILCNPPYVTDAAMAALPAEYRHEPALALAAGADGMNAIGRLLREARSHLKDTGLLVVEVGGGRATVEEQFGDLPLTWLTTSAGDDMVFLVKQEDLR